MFLSESPARIDTQLDSRSISFENPTGARGAGGAAASGRKGAPSRLLAPGEKLVLADIEGPGRIRHVWMTFPPDTPEEMRSLWMEVCYDGLDTPSISVPCLDFFGLPHGRPAAYESALVSVHEGRGFNAYFPMPFNRRIRIELTNSGAKAKSFYYQIDYTLQPLEPGEGYLHVAFRRENPTTPKRDFIIASGLKGPGRFLGCVVGIRVMQDGMNWYGEGEFKVYRDGDRELPTICGTGLEDYIGTAWEMQQYTAMYAGVPVCRNVPQQSWHAPSKWPLDAPVDLPDFVSFYRWHLPDPIMFRDSLEATIQQIGLIRGSGDRGREFQSRYVPAGNGWLGKEALAKRLPLEMAQSLPPDIVQGLAERSDDYCAAAFLYCREPQAVPRLDIALALADIGLRPYEKALSLFT